MNLTSVEKNPIIQEDELFNAYWNFHINLLKGEEIDLANHTTIFDQPSPQIEILDDLVALMRENLANHPEIHLNKKGKKK